MKTDFAKARAVLYMTALVRVHYSPHVNTVCVHLSKASPRCPLPSVQQDASGCIYALAYSKLNNRINTIT
ncbi:MAG: hypothetical protein DID91_2727702308 [Candidatus Nitrotoga sp. MKT]|nr:MAG: hypothetical protein DID91_2727702308 [Candidatus Nitrotoga sp. MKT]